MKLIIRLPPQCSDDIFRNVDRLSSTTRRILCEAFLYAHPPRYDGFGYRLTPDHDEPSANAALRDSLAESFFLSCVRLDELDKDASAPRYPRYACVYFMESGQKSEALRAYFMEAFRQRRCTIIIDAHEFFLWQDDPQHTDTLISSLEQCGSSSAAESFLNSGNSRLAIAGREWAIKHHYTILPKARPTPTRPIGPK